MPATDPAIPPDQWPLSPAGRAAARALDVPRNARVLSSDERKAVETAEQLDPGELIVDPRVRETTRPHEWRDDFRDRVRAYLAGTRHPGWEAHADVVARFDAAVREHQPDILVTHVQAMTLWLHAKGTIYDPVTFWDELVFPHAVAV